MDTAVVFAGNSFLGKSLWSLLRPRGVARHWKLRVFTVRPFNVIGPGLPDHYFAAALARRLFQMRSCGEPGPFPVMNLDATRDFVDVRDVADALAGLLSDATPAAG